MQTVNENEVEQLLEANDGHLFDVVPDAADSIVDWAIREQEYKGSSDPDECYYVLVGEEMDKDQIDFELLASLFNHNDEINDAFWEAYDEFVHGGWSEVGESE